MQAVKTRRRAFLAPTIRHNETLNPMSAVLHSVCAGYGLHSNGVSSAVLAEANTPFALQEHAIQAGLVATPFMVPPDLLTNPPLFQHPLIVRSIADEDAPARMMIVWNQLFTWIQLMDTATGQRWVNQQQLIAETAVDTVTLTPDEWLAMATSSLWQPLWLHRLQALGFERSHALDFLQTPLSSADWHTVAALDAALRLVSQFQKKRLLRTGRSARESFVHIYQQAIDAGPTQSHLVLPLVYWSVRPAPDSELSAPATLTYQAVQVVQLAAPLSDASSTTVSSPDVAPTPAEDEKALPSSTGASVPQTIVAFLRREGRLPFVILTTALIFAAGSVVLQALLLHGAMNIGLIFSATEQRFTLMSLLITFAVVLLLLEWHINATIARIGRRLDARLRIAVLERLPTLGPLTLQQRSTADQMERIHAARDLHNLPEFVARVVRNGLLLVFTVLGIAWIDPVSAFLGLLIVAVVFSPLFLLRSSLEALNLDARTRLAGLMRLNLDGMLGLPAILAHSAENTIRSVYETYLARWVRSILNLARVEFWVAACEQTLVYFLIALTVGWFALRTGDGTDLPLLLFWLLQLAVVGREFARNMFRYENEQSKCTRFVDLLMETETGVAPVTPAASQSPNVAQTEAAPLPNAGVAITFSHVSVASLEQPILDHVHLDIVPGSTVAIVGPSGAGKSTLLGLLLGKQQPASGAITIDGQLLDGQHLTYIRQNTAWVDPSVQIWNRSFLYNVRYGGEQTPINWILDHANLRDVLALLPDGMQTSLGERGRLVAGGQGQRVRLGRAFQRPDARLVLLDEPFRGLEREQRAALLAQARSFWSGATFLCVTHDIAHTTSFDRVLVVEHGRIVEDGAPADLLAQPKSRYKTFFDAEQRVHQRLWFGNAIAWRELWMENGQLHERTSRLADHQRSISLANPNRTHPAPVSSAVAPSIPDTRNDLDQLAWPAADASEAVRVLATASGLIQKSSSPPPGEDTTRPVSLAQQIMSTAGELGLEAQPLDVTYQQIMAVLQDGGPALIQLADDRLLLIRGGTRWWTSIIGPDGRTRRLRPGVIHDALAQSVEAPLQAEGAGVLDHLNLSATQRSQAQRLLFQAQLPDAPVTHAWLLHPSPGMSLFQQMRDAGLWRYLAIALTGEFALSVLYIAVFAISAFATVRGYIEPVWLVAVLLLLLLRLPAEMARWWGERFMGVGLRDVLKRRLFFGIVHVQPDTVQHHGTGQFLGWVMESERLEEIARAGPVAS
ncbi:MAG: ABC transporter ATP-binding protein [Chloroflexaceae bacterium]|nr:ABC transporter ATP-binding protein [Chloroflexaceae bacterium]